MQALIIVDMQNDFLPTGALPVKEGDQIIPIINALQSHFPLVVATKDWHPKNHGSFAVNHHKKPGEVILLEGIPQILWPVHCVENTAGAAFAPQLHTSRIEKIFYKGIDPHYDSYSAFFDNAHKRSTGLNEFLKSKKVSQVYLAGLATDYCVKYSVLDAIREGFDVSLIADACRGVNLKKGDSETAIEEMRLAGVHILNSQFFINK